jgi:hypothetical protein
MKNNLYALLLLQLLLSASLAHAKLENCDIDPKNIQELLDSNEVSVIFNSPIIVDPLIRGDFLSRTNHEQFFLMKDASTKKRKVKRFVIDSIDQTNLGKIISFRAVEDSPVAFVNMNLSFEDLQRSQDFTLVCNPK